MELINPLISTKKIVARLEIFMTLKMRVMVFWVMIPQYSGWRWRQHGPFKHWYPSTSLCGVMTQKVRTK